MITGYFRYVIDHYKLNTLKHIVNTWFPVIKPFYGILNGTFSHQKAPITPIWRHYHLYMLISTRCIEKIPLTMSAVLLFNMRKQPDAL